MMTFIHKVKNFLFKKGYACPGDSKKLSDREVVKHTGYIHKWQPHIEANIAFIVTRHNDQIGFSFSVYVSIWKDQISYFIYL